MEINVSLEVLNNISEIEVVYKRKPNCKMSERPVIVSSKDAYQIFNHYWNQDRIGLLEEFKVLFVNRAMRALQLFNVSQGGLTGTVADLRIILAAALKLGAYGMFLAHNHPSCNLAPSTADREVTLKLKEAAKYHDIKVLDHLILSAEGYFSFTDDGLL